MTKADFIAKLSEKTGFSKKDSEKALNGFIDVVKDALKNGEKVLLQIKKKPSFEYSLNKILKNNV